MSSSDEDSKIDLLGQPSSAFEIKRKAENGGDIACDTFEELEKGFLLMGIQWKNTSMNSWILLEKLFESPELKELVAKAYPIQKKKKTAVEDSGIIPSRLDLRVGKIVSVSLHPEAENLYVETVDLGEEKPRTVVSGLAGLVPKESLENKLGVFLCNLKPARMKGIESSAMLLCASLDNPRQVEPLIPPQDSAPGEKIFVEGYSSGQPDDELKPKKKIWEKLQPDFRVNSQYEAEWQGSALVSKLGKVITKTVKNSPIK
ncbi:hypothetical protein Btru_077091 [Bulinus truncatus]|nr:hypothetical protein Btru_077091 [Bulinus truncatus]